MEAYYKSRPEYTPNKFQTLCFLLIILPHLTYYYIFSHKSLTKFTQNFDIIEQNLSIVYLTLQSPLFKAVIYIFFKQCVYNGCQRDKQQDTQHPKQGTAHRDGQQYPYGWKSGSFPGDLRIDEVVFDLADDIKNQG
jgi:hypothetical protein